MSESTLVKMPHCLKSHVATHIISITDADDDFGSNCSSNSLSVGSGNERENRARSPSQERGRKKDRFGLQDYNFIKVLGKGSFGKVGYKVLLVVLKSPGSKVNFFFVLNSGEHEISTAYKN